MVGVITTKHLIIHCYIIIKEFGLHTYIKALKSAFKHGTFLEII